MAALWRERRDGDVHTLTVGPGNVPDALPETSDACLQVQFAEPLSAREHAQIGALLAFHQHAYLRAFCYLYRSQIRSLDFLRHYPSLTSFHADLYDVDDFEGLALLPPDTRYVGIGRTKKKIGRLHSLLRLDASEDLHLEGQDARLAELSPRTAG